MRFQQAAHACFVVSMILSVASDAEMRLFRKSGAHSFLPQNSLSEEDDVTSGSGISRVYFDAITVAAEKYYGHVALKNGERFVVQRDWNDSTVNAYSARSGKHVEVSVFGGLARRPEMTPESFALVLCHEISHVYGGEPYANKINRISAEGQADYQSPRECFLAVLPVLNFSGLPESDSAATLVRDMCSKTQGDKNSYCHAVLWGGVGVAKIIASMKGESVPRYDTPDATVVSTTILRYPATSQCRLDTIRAGFFTQERPRCWYVNENYRPSH